jgi:hydroxymethylbilane synthase
VTDLPTIVRIGTRGSALARWQADHVAGLLRAAHAGLRVEIAVIETHGDRVLDKPLPLIGGKGLFTAELEAALRGGEIDFAVHSLKDLPTENPPGLIVGAVPRRANPQDVLVSRSGAPLDALPPGAAVGTSSRRRAAQVLRRRPDLHIIDIRGNVDTRLRKAGDPGGPYDAVVLARAGVERLGRLDDVTEVLPFDVMLPAPGQGAMGVQCRDDVVSRAVLLPLTHRETRIAVTAERAFLTALGGGCAVPVAAHADVDRGNESGGALRLRGRVTAVGGDPQVEVADSCHLPADLEPALGAAESLGRSLAEEAIAQGAAAILEAVRG